MVIGGHAHSGYDTALTHILNELTLMGEKADAMLAMFANALAGKETEQTAAKSTDKEVNRLEYDISEQLHFILTRYTPSVAELRFLTSMIKIAASLERVGDIAKLGISTVSDQKLASSYKKECQTLQQLLGTTRQMFASSLENLPDYDPEKMILVVQQEKRVIEASDKLLHAFLKKATTDSETHAQATSDVLQLIRSIERLADHALDILRMSFYAHTGKRLKRKKLLASG